MNYICFSWKYLTGFQVMVSGEAVIIAVTKCTVKPRNDNNKWINNAVVLPLCRTDLVAVGDGVSVALNQPVSGHFTDLGVAAGLWRQRERLVWFWSCVRLCAAWTLVPGWSSWAGSLETVRLSETSRGLEEHETRPAASTRFLLWNPPFPRKCCPPSGFRSIQLTCMRWGEKECLYPITVATRTQTHREKGWSQTLPTRNICSVVETDLA